MLKIGDLIIAKRQEIFSVVDKALDREKSRRYARKYNGTSQKAKPRRRYDSLLD